jgi:hypothetical protein
MPITHFPLITCQFKNLGPTNAGPRFLRKGAFGDTIVVTVFAFIAAPAAGFASLSHEFAVLGAIKLDFLVLFHFTSSCLSAEFTAVGSCYVVRQAPDSKLKRCLFVLPQATACIPIGAESHGRI